MRAEKQEARRREIERAAYAVLAEKGYEAASMLAIAKRAGASNETLYNWYGNKQTLFRSLVQANAQQVADLLRDSIASGRDPLDTLARLGPLLLRLLVSDKAIALNRAAVADAAGSGLLGKALAEAGRNTVAPLIAQVFEQAHASRQLTVEHSGEAADIYVSLLVGDLQIRRAIGVLKGLRDVEIQRRADRALRFMKVIFARSER
ncbi:TetR/AcrR family transcriptional regulator [Reyranella sp. CPCC 100927]|uniref:TetR/AcrR family transcriptional regulator n=1 Tax=Reyranella sp. CPCC 100927 TaxID=2599616 RepID=UPI0011B6BC34|nr:TetR/AcrR family transcriptional regulator [Reyranella sp. CPCC 100927]TWS98338.1 TetR/AcrR family transcriptional regulator [Reyranella sp. CPCC 100927]